MRFLRSLLLALLLCVAGGAYAQGVCSNGASDYPYCQSCPSGQSMIAGLCKASSPGMSWSDPAQMGQGLFIAVLGLCFGVGVFAGQQR